MMPRATGPGRAIVAACLLLLAGSAAGAASGLPADGIPDLAAIQTQVYSGEYAAAAARLDALSRTVRHADVFNLLGYTLRQLGRHEEAARWYREALDYDPGHRPTLEYQGELFIATGDIESARRNLRYLELLCAGGPCPEYDVLRAALDKHTLPSPAHSTTEK